MRMSDLTHCFYVPGKPGIIDAVHPETGLGVWSGETLEQVQKRYPGAVKEDFDVATQANDDHWRQAPSRISSEKFHEALNVLPPEDWRHGTGDCESFKMSERTSGSITAIYARVGSEYWHLADSYTLTHEQILERIREATQ